MPTLNKTTFEKTQELPIGVEYTAEFADQTCNLVDIESDADLGPLLASLPNGQCHCPHWGYLITGTLTVTYSDRVETIQAGDAFYMPPGHVPKAHGGSRFVLFSPSDELAATDAAIMRGLASNAQVEA